MDIQSLQITNAGEGMEKKEPSFTVGSMYICTTIMENNMEVP